jgi:hypothetical protein
MPILESAKPLRLVLPAMVLKVFRWHRERRIWPVKTLTI